VYLARAARDIAPVIAAVRALGIRGCSVSMPFKSEVVRHLDALDAVAAEVGAVNTVVNDDGRLTGYNTDVGGVVAAIQRANTPIDTALVLGAGGMSRAVVAALARLGVRDIAVCARRRQMAEAICGSRSCRVIDWGERASVRADLLINATSVGMAPAAGETPMPETALGGFRVVADVVASPADTPLLVAAQQRGCIVVNGLEIALHQAFEQFGYYTRCDPPVAAMRLAAERLAGGRP
jgi:shikimate dehydrogenase